MKKYIILIFTVIIISVIIWLFLANRSSWKKDEKGLWQKTGDTSKEVPTEIIADCFKNPAKLSAGLVVGDCQKRLCAADDQRCKSRVTDYFNGKIK